MNKIFTIFLLLIFSFGIISCSDSDSSGANSKLGSVLDQPNSTDDENSLNLPVISGSCYLLDNSTYDNSTIDNSSISDNSSITSSTVKNCSTVVSNSTVDNSSTIDNSTISGYSDVNSSYVCSSIVDNSTIDNSTICLSTIGDNSTIRHSFTDNHSTIDNSTLIDSNFDNSTIRDSYTDNSTGSGGTNLDNVTSDNLTCVNCDLIDLTCTGCILDNTTICNAGLDNVTLTNVTACQDDGSGGYIRMRFDNETREGQTMTETDAPYVASTTPAQGVDDQGRTANIVVIFSESMDTSTIITSVSTSSCSGATFMVSKVSDNFSSNGCTSMSAVPAISNDNKTFTITPTAPGLETDKEPYYIRVTTGAKDPSGNALSGNGAYGWTSDNVTYFETD